MWDHAGADVTQHRSVALMRQLLQSHSNLYMALNLGRHPPPTHPNSPVGTDGLLRPEWISLIEDFSDRFVLGSDQFYQGPGASFIFTGNFLFESHAAPDEPGYVTTYFKVAALALVLPFAWVTTGTAVLGVTRRSA